MKNCELEEVLNHYQLKRKNIFYKEYKFYKLHWKTKKSSKRMSQIENDRKQNRSLYMKKPKMITIVTDDP